MTKDMKIEMKCSMCGKKSDHPALLSSNQLGHQDLDTRPPEMYRSTMYTWILECPHCGYVAGNLEENPTVNMDFIETEKYKTCDGINFKSSLSKIFYKYYLIVKETCEDEDKFFAILQCAWTCDDAGDLENSKHTRRVAIDIVEKVIARQKNIVDNFIVIKADLLRRIGEFDQLIDEYENITLNDELLDKIVRFQVEKAYEKDDGCYTLKEVL